MNPTIPAPDNKSTHVHAPISTGRSDKVLVPSAADEFLDDLPAVVQFPVVTSIQAKFQEVGRHIPLPFPDQDDS